MTRQNEAVWQEIDRLADRYEQAQSRQEKVNLRNCILCCVEKVLFPRVSDQETVNPNDKRSLQYDAAVKKLLGTNDKPSILEMPRRPGVSFSAYLWKAIHNDICDEQRKNKPLVPIGEKTEKADPADTAESRLRADELLLLFVPLMDNLEKHLHRRENNAVRRQFTALFYTERMVCVCKQWYEDTDSTLQTILKRREQLIMQSMTADFVGHFLEAECRSLAEIVGREYRCNDYFGIRQSPSERLSTPFKNRVYVTYFLFLHHQKVSDMTVSEQKKYFTQLLRRIEEK